MKTLQVIPAIDIIGGKCVRLTRGDYSLMNIYKDDPLEAALAFRDAGARRLHLVDLDGAKSSIPVNLDVLERIVSRTGLTVEFGGGIKSAASLDAALDAGASYVICGSIAVTDLETFSSWLACHPGRIILSLDLRDGLVATRGWLDTSGLTARDVLRRFSGSLEQAVVTRIECDGTLSGVDVGFYESLQSEFPDIDIIVSGGVSSQKDLDACERAGLRAAIVGKALYEGRIDPKKLFRGGETIC